MTAERLVIAVDCDDVLVPTASQIISAYNRDYGTNLELKDFYSSAAMDTWGTDDERVAIERVGSFLRSDEHASVKPFPEAIKSIAALAVRHELHLVTGRSDYLEPVTKRTLDVYFPGCFSSIEHTNFFEGEKKRSKGEVCKALGADVLIDDHIIHGESVLSSGVKRVIVFGDYPWNKMETLPTGMVRCKNWQDVLDDIDSLTK